MYQLLIVDDEKYIVDGLYEMLQEVDHIELDIYRAYSAEEAIQWLERTKMDMVLSDIRMPGMNGLELQRNINDRWPHCKVIFLTGMNDFEYTQAAFRGGSIDYVLKTEGDEEIITALDKAIISLSEDIQNEQIIQKANEQMHLALPTLQKDYLFSLLEDEFAAKGLKQDHLRQLRISLSADHPVLLVMGRIDQWREELSATDKALLLYATQNIAAECFSSLSIVPIIIDQIHFVWFIQPSEGSKGVEDPDTAEEWIRVIRFVRGTLDSVQRNCRELLRTPISLIHSSSPTIWDEVSVTYNHLRKLLFIGMGHGMEMLLTDSELEWGGHTSGSVNCKQQINFKPFNADDLHVMLAREQETEFMRMLDHFIGEDELLAYNYSYYLEVYYSIASLFLSYMNQWGLVEQSTDELNIDKLMNIQNHHSKVEAMEYLRFTAGILFRYKKGEQDERTHRVIMKINEYIVEHIGNDLSLTSLSEVVHLNPSYLSRLYKQYTGYNVSDYISELKFSKAKEMLEQPKLKIHEIGTLLGFETAGYFTRFFKKHLDLTPQEYRNSLDK